MTYPLLEGVHISIATYMWRFRKAKCGYFSCNVHVIFELAMDRMINSCPALFGLVGVFVFETMETWVSPVIFL